MRKLLLSAAAISMVAGTTVAQAAPIDAPRTGAEIEGEGLSGVGILPLLLGLGAIIFAIYVIVDDNEDDDDSEIPISV